MILIAICFSFLLQYDRIFNEDEGEVGTLQRSRKGNCAEDLEVDTYNTSYELQFAHTTHMHIYGESKTDNSIMILRMMSYPTLCLLPILALGVFHLKETVSYCTFREEGN